MGHKESVFLSVDITILTNVRLKCRWPSSPPSTLGEMFAGGSRLRQRCLLGDPAKGVKSRM